MAQLTLIPKFIRQPNRKKGKAESKNKENVKAYNTNTRKQNLQLKISKQNLEAK